MHSLLIKSLILLGLIVGAAHVNAAGPIVDSKLQAYFSRFEGRIYNHQNVYAKTKGNKGESSIVLEDYSIKDRITLNGDELFINLSGEKILLARFEGIEDLREGERKMIDSIGTIKTQELKKKTKRTFHVFSCEGIFCGVGPYIEKKEISLYQIETENGVRFCLNNGYYQKRQKLYKGECQK